MKFPKVIKTYCPTCKAQTEHKASLVKHRQRPKARKHGLSWGVRQYFRVVAGYGAFPRKQITKKAKTSTKPTFKLTCVKCNKATIRAFRRTKKVSQV